MNIVAKSDDKSVRVRFPKPVLVRLDEEAARAGRSRNTEIVMRLGESLGIVKPNKK